jgi:hypothetical protein
VTDEAEACHAGRTLQIRFRTETERAQIDAAAARAALPPSTYARTLLLGANPPRQAYRPSVSDQDLARALWRLSVIANVLRVRVPVIAAELDDDFQAVGDLIKRGLGRRRDGD